MNRSVSRTWILNFKRSYLLCPYTFKIINITEKILKTCLYFQNRRLRYGRQDRNISVSNYTRGNLLGWGAGGSFLVGRFAESIIPREVSWRRGAIRRAIIFQGTVFFLPHKTKKKSRFFNCSFKNFISNKDITNLTARKSKRFGVFAYMITKTN